MQHILSGWQHILFKKMGHFILKVILKVGYTRLSKKCVVHNYIFFCPGPLCLSLQFYPLSQRKCYMFERTILSFQSELLNPLFSLEKNSFFSGCLFKPSFEYSFCLEPSICSNRVRFLSISLSSDWVLQRLVM